MNTEQDLKDAMLHDPRPESRYILYACDDFMGRYGVVTSRDDLQKLISVAKKLSPYDERGWQDWHEVVERATGKTIYSTRLALQIVPTICPLCPPCDPDHLIGDDFFGEPCILYGVRCCAICYNEYWWNQSMKNSEEDNNGH